MPSNHWALYRFTEFSLDVLEVGLAEGEGFEPPLPFRVKRFSRPPVSTAHTSLRVSEHVRLVHCTTTSAVASPVVVHIGCILAPAVPSWRKNSADPRHRA